MKKADIERLAKRQWGGNRPGETVRDKMLREAEQVERICKIASDAREAPQERADAEAVNLTPETIQALGEAVAVAVCSRLARLLPVIARLAAADTVHTMHQPPTVFKHAIDEGIAAANLMEGNS